VLEKPLGQQNAPLGHLKPRMPTKELYEPQNMPNLNDVLPGSNKEKKQ